MITKLCQIWRPESYHGTGKKNNFFEGWFFKLVDKSRQHIYAVIPGIFSGSKSEESHAFIQILDGKTHASSYHRYPLDQFKAARDRLRIQIESNHFSDKEISLSIESKKRIIQGTVYLGDLQPWPIKFFTPGVMGWYAFVPFMECFHGILSLDHPLSGQLQTDTGMISFDGGRGYIEKDWGKSFPEAYIWMQCNHFNRTDSSLSVSIAKIPWLTGAFRGFIIGLWWDGRLYPFTTYNGARLNRVSVTEKKIGFDVEKDRYLLRVSAEKSNQGQLHGPYQNQMLNHVSESLDSRLTLEFYEKDGESWQNIIRLSGEPAAVEANGRLEEIVDDGR
jgi:tocopherol cyclase